METTELKTTEAAVTITHKDWCKAIRAVAKKAGKVGYESGISLRAKHLILGCYDDYMVVIPAWKAMLRGCA